ncbi:MAG: rod shape-determining protein MreC [Candidatus Paceibacterota bacterium]|jgi:cell shape-determining protein MreC
MTYLRDNEKRKKRNRVFLLLIAVAFLFYYQHKIISFFSDKTALVAKPALESVSVLKEKASNGILSVFLSKSSLVAQNNGLKNELDESRAKLLDYSRLFAENSELKTLLGRNEQDKTLLASVISKPNQSPYDTIIVDVGEKNSVFAGAQVLAYGDIIIGKISEVSNDTSKATLFSSPGEEYEGMVLGKNISLKLLGRGGGNFISEFPRGVLIEQGDQVYSVGLLPHLLGTVQNISSDPRDPFQTVLVRGPINMAELRFVEIIL